MIAVRTHAYVLSTTALNNEIRSIMHIVTQDLRRATAPVDGVSPTVEISADHSCVVFNVQSTGVSRTHPNELAIEAGTLIPTGYRLRNGRLQVWYTPEGRPTESFGKCDQDDYRWHTLIQSGDRGLSVKSFDIDPGLHTRCLELDAPSRDTPDLCPPDGHNLLELLTLRVTLGGEIEIGTRSGSFELSDVIHIRNNRYIN